MNGVMRWTSMTLRCHVQPPNLSPAHEAVKGYEDQSTVPMAADGEELYSRAFRNRERDFSFDPKRN